MWMLSVFCLVVTALLCIIGALSHSYNENLVQLLGMAGLAIGCFARALAILHAQSTNNDWLIVHASMAFYAVGTAIRFWGAYRAEGKRAEGVGLKCNPPTNSPPPCRR